jgi:hypothetical protein
MAGAGTERERAMTAIAEALHDMCQPLTALHCRLEIAQMNEGAVASSGGTAVWTDCLRECDRLIEAVVTMRNLVRQARASDQGETDERIGFGTGCDR